MHFLHIDLHGRSFYFTEKQVVFQGRTRRPFSNSPTAIPNSCVKPYLRQTWCSLDLLKLPFENFSFPRACSRLLATNSSTETLATVFPSTTSRATTALSRRVREQWRCHASVADEKQGHCGVRGRACVAPSNRWDGGWECGVVVGNGPGDGEGSLVMQSEYEKSWERGACHRHPFGSYGDCGLRGRLASIGAYAMTAFLLKDHPPLSMSSSLFFEIKGWMLLASF